MAASYPVMTRAEVEKADGKNGNKALVIVNGDILDVTEFAEVHPGGVRALLDYAGKDATKIFYALHRHEVLEKRLRRLKKAELQGYDKKNNPPSWKDLSRVPYAEIDMENSPYWNESHKRFRMECRRFFWEDGIFEWCEAAENSGNGPTRELYQQLGREGYLALSHGLGPHLAQVPEPNLWSRAGLKLTDLDWFHFTILTEERTRMCCPGAEDALTSGVSIGLGPVLHFGQKWVHEEVVGPVLRGEKVICLAITEPYAGSDVAGVQTTAVKSEDGSYYTVTGTKKWITNAVFADYYTTLVRTGGPGAGGLSMLLIEKGDGVVVRKIPTDYSIAAGTGLISFENVRVPARNLLGKEGAGMKVTMNNFNTERLGICSMALGRSRRIIEECFLWANQREAFGKTLLDQPVVRNEIGQMIAEHQAAYSYFLMLVRKYNTTPAKETGKLGGDTALLKYRVTRATTLIADLSVQVFGGRGITKTGMGKNISRMQKSFKFAAVYGGSEEIMLDLGVRQARKIFPKTAKL